MIDGVSVCEGFRGYFWHCGCSVVFVGGIQNKNRDANIRRVVQMLV